MGNSRKLIAYSFFAVLITAMFLLALNRMVDWSTEGGRSARLQNAVRAEILEIRTAIPPGMIIEIENTGDTSIGRTHIAMEFKALNSRFNRNRDWSLISFDIEGLGPGEKKQIDLRCRADDFSPVYRRLADKQVIYSLMVYPEWRDPIRPIQGRVVLK